MKASMEATEVVLRGEITNCLKVGGDRTPKEILEVLDGTFWLGGLELKDVQTAIDFLVRDGVVKHFRDHFAENEPEPVYGVAGKR